MTINKIYSLLARSWQGTQQQSG